LYEVVLAAHQASIQKAAPGESIKELHETSKRVLTEGLVDLGLLPRGPEDSLAMHHYREFFMHGTSHWLGMDVHDVGDYWVDGAPRALESGMVLTVEPGLYVAKDAECDPKWHGIGVRIEDDVAVTDDGRDVLTTGIPKDPGEIERTLRARQ